MTKSIFVALAALAVAVPCSGQQRQVSGYANYVNPMHSSQTSWGGGAQYQLTWGSQQSPVRLNTALAGDYQRQENRGQSQTDVSYDMTLQPGGNGAVTPYVGGSVSANWLSGDGVPSGAKLGLQYVLGAQLKPDSQGPVSLLVEVRPGYVKTQAHSTTGRIGVAFTM